jgi:hypothetical protein
VPGRRVWTLEEVRALGLTCDITTAAHILGIGRTLAFDLLRDGTFPVRVLRFGRAARIAVPELLDYLQPSDGAKSIEQASTAVAAADPPVHQARSVTGPPRW